VPSNIVPAGYRGLTLATSASDLLPICHPPLGPSANRANKTIGPAQFQQICCTCLFGRKPFIKFLYRPRIVNATNRKIFDSRVIHAPTILSRERNGYPPPANMRSLIPLHHFRKKFPPARYVGFLINIGEMVIYRIVTTSGSFGDVVLNRQKPIKSNVL
jgi:hypothetical protein